MITKADIAMVRSLADRKARAELGLFVVEGPKMVEETLRSKLEVERLFGTEDYRHLKGIVVVSPREMERMSNLKTPQGVLALVRIPRHDIPGNLGQELTLAMDGVQDPGNLGTIVRTADWFGVRDIVCSPDTADCFNPKSVQASMGAILRVRVHYSPLVPVLERARTEKIPIYGTFLEGENIYALRVGITPAGLVVMGNEGRGIRPEVAALVSRKILIPSYPASTHTSESLNVAVATAIICSEFRRRIL